jgi:CYTH domain-containing protein
LDYQFSAINLFTNYDGEGSSFGDISVPAITTEVEKFTAYAAADSEDDSRVTVVASNKTDVPQTVQLRLQNSGYNTASYGIYSIAEGSSEIISGDVPAIVSVPESIIVHLPAMSVSQVEIKLGGQVEILPVLGDVNTDGYVTVADIVMLAEFLLDSELVTLTEEAFTAADIDCNGTLNVKDLMYIVLHVSGRIEKLEDIAPDPQDVETERKFLVLAEDLPLEAMEAGSKYELTQTYISYDPEERVRKVEYDSGTVGYFHTIKKPIDEDLLSRVEIETQITEEEYEEYLTGQLGITIHKTRYQFYDENDVYTAVDVFSEKLEGLIYAEVEFDSVKESEDFVPPAWFGADVTSESLYKNADLSQLDDRYGIYGWYIEDGQIWIPILTPDKPVIYLYPTEQTDVSVKLDYKGVLDFTYPSIFDGGWEVTANPDGTLINKRDGREYSYLFWEGHGQASYDLSKGFVVKGEDTEEFLQEKLAYMGLLPKEYNEFIVYWLPQMQNNAYNFITFQGKEYTDTAALTVTPEPDSMLRVFMTFQGLDKPIEVPEQTLTPFTRQGFAVVEWGGCELK